MSTQSGITASAELLEGFKNLEKGALVIRVSEDKTSLKIDETIGEDEASLEKLMDQIKDFMKRDFPNPAYLIVALNEEASSDKKDAFISFIPDVAPIRQKMLYASTKNTILNELGSNNFPKSKIFAFTELDELHVNEILNKENSMSSSNEKLSGEVDSSQSLSAISHSYNTSKQDFKNKLTSFSDSSQSKTLRFSFEDSLTSALEGLKENGDTGVLIVIDINKDKEQFCLVQCTKQVSIDELVGTLRSNTDTGEIHPYFAVYTYAKSKISFIYTCPTSSKVKDRMIYASNKQGLQLYITSLFKPKFDIDDVEEVGDLEELEISHLKQTPEDLEPKNTAVNSNFRFNKPKGPRRR